MAERGDLPSTSDPLSVEESAADEQQRISELELRLAETELALRLSNGKLRMALDVGRLGAWEQDMSTGEVKGTSTFKACLGLPPDAGLASDQFQTAFHPDDAARIHQAIAFATRTKTDFQIDHRVIKSDGGTGHVLTRGAAIYEDDGIIRLVGIIQDSTEREKIREGLAQAQRRQEFLLAFNDQIGNEEDPLVIMEIATSNLAKFLNVDASGYSEVFEETGTIVVHREWSRGLLTNEGKTEKISSSAPDIIEELRLGRPVMSSDLLEDPRYAAPAVRAYYASANIRSGMSIPLLKSGKLSAILHVFSSSPRHWLSEDVDLLEDIAERTWVAVEKARAKRALRETEARFQLIAESLPALVWILDPTLALTYTNERWVRYSGLGTKEALGHSWMSAIHPDDMARIQRDVEPVVRNHTAYETEARYRSGTGEYRWHIIKGAPIHGADGEFKGWVGTSVDIHDFKGTEEALRTSEQQLRLALQAARMGDWSWDASSDICTLSDRAAEIFGLPPGSILPRSELHEHVHSADRPRIRAVIDRAVRNGTQYNVEYRVENSTSKKQVWVASQGQVTFNPDGTRSGMAGVFQDITDRKHAEERQQLLIRELHHRVKNTLATVQAIVGSTARTATSIDEFYQGFVGRIVSLARTHNLLTEDLWQKAALEELVQTELGPYEDEARNRIIVEGPHVELPSEAAVPIGMAIHELTTNAAKHGALSTFGGQVEARWRIEPGMERPMLHFTWRENGGPRVTSPARQGFGSRLLQRVLTTQLQADVKMDFHEDGLHFTMILPIPGEPPLFNPDK